ncbi:DUF1853 family protein [Paraburkholderia sediminicola]|uniref:DUF1853 family protein n=1 Tax=Paraburkholderia sediminicola TaxID=458836 RepID=UPI0038B6BD2D
MTDANEPAARLAAAPGTSAAILGKLLDTLREPAVRDLAWLLLSADLLRAQPPVGALASPFDTQQEAEATINWLRALDADPADLQRDLAATRITRLGRYAERLLGWFLQHGPAARLVAAGVPLRRSGVTLGECDFLVQTQRGARLHWELAVKCYLHAGESRAQLATQSTTQSAARLADYVGPNLKDRFDLKLAHVLNHQLPLSAREEFASVGHAGPWTPQMFIKGWLFYRAGEMPADPVELDPAHGRGWWVTRSEWTDFAAAHAQMWRLLPRLEWLAPRRYEPGAVGTPGEAAGVELAFVDARTLAAQTSHLHGPTMVAAFVDDSAGNRIERSRGFIVPNEWPELAQDYARQP